MLTTEKCLHLYCRFAGFYNTIKYTLTKFKEELYFEKTFQLINKLYGFTVKNNTFVFVKETETLHLYFKCFLRKKMRIIN